MKLMSRFVPWLLVALCFVLGVASRSISDSFVVFVPALQSAFDASRSSVTLVYSFALLVVSALPAFFGLATYVYLAGAILVGAALTFVSFAFLADRTPRSARRLFMSSNIYLIVAMLLLVLA